MDVKITEHAYERGKERLSLKHDSLDRLAETAYHTGLKHSETKGKLRKYIDKLWFTNQTANNIKIYGENIFIFSKNLLITVYQLPNDLRKYIKHSQKD